MIVEVPSVAATRQPVKGAPRVRAEAWLSAMTVRFAELGLPTPLVPPKIVEGERGLVVLEWFHTQKPLRELLLVFPVSAQEPPRYMRWSDEDAPDFPGGECASEDTFRLLWAWLEREERDAL